MARPCLKDEKYKIKISHKMKNKSSFNHAPDVQCVLLYYHLTVLFFKIMVELFISFCFQSAALY